MGLKTRQLLEKSLKLSFIKKLYEFFKRLTEEYCSH